VEHDRAEHPGFEGARAFYGSVFGWELDSLDFGGDPTWMARVPGYGEFLTRYEPGMQERQAEAGVPTGFADAVAWVSRPTTDRLSDTPTWSTIFAIADTDGIANRAVDSAAESSCRRWMPARMSAWP
jgi:hypothetical protein